MSKTSSINSAIVHFIHQNLIWLIVTSYLIATLLPALGIWMRQVSLGSVHFLGGDLMFTMPQLMLAILLFNAGLGVKLTELTDLFSKSSLLIGGVLANVLTPLLFIGTVSVLMKLWHSPEEVQQILVGLALVASMPIAGASTAWSQNANGNLALSLGLVLLTTFLSPLLTPLILHAVGFVTTGDYSEDLHELASGGVVSFLGVWVILPSLLGILSRKLMGEKYYNEMKLNLKLFNYIILILLNYCNASLTLPQVLSDPDYDYLLLILVVVTSLCIAAFASGHWLANYFNADRNSKIALMFGLGMNNNGTGLVLASVALVDHPQVLLPIIFYNLVQHLVASIVDRNMFSSLDE
ncbi:bile acid:sodium symporter [Methylomonas sp. AM2-LC]|uniref:bile acid:sodium symporter family protein n=1 Tax=Methylomonas sp. AM2-LC TaxID=3153301 RepID=UPI0032637AC2